MKQCQAATAAVTDHRHLGLAQAPELETLALVSVICAPLRQPFLPSLPFPSVFLSLSLCEAHEIRRRSPPETPTAAVNEASSETPSPHNMATIVTSTRFTDEYQLYEELGK